MRGSNFVLACFNKRWNIIRALNSRRALFLENWHSVQNLVQTVATFSEMTFSRFSQSSQLVSQSIQSVSQPSRPSQLVKSVSQPIWLVGESVNWSSHLVTQTVKLSESYLSSFLLVLVKIFCSSLVFLVFQFSSLPVL